MISLHLAPRAGWPTVFFLLLGWMVLPVCGSALSFHSETAPQVKLRRGTLAGIRFGASPHNAAFLGIPYAAAAARVEGRSQRQAIRTGVSADPQRLVAGDAWPQATGDE